MIEGFPKRQHYLKFQGSVPISHSKRSKEAYEKVLNTAVAHLKAVAGSAAFNVEVRAVFQDRGPGQTGITWRDILVVVGFDGPLTDEGKKLQIERNAHEFQKLTGGMKASPIDLGGLGQAPVDGKVLLS